MGAREIVPDVSVRDVFPCVWSGQLLLVQAGAPVEEAVTMGTAHAQLAAYVGRPAGAAALRQLGTISPGHRAASPSLNALCKV
jgi:hypothetical protein